MNLKEIGKVLTSKSVGTGPLSYEKRIYRAMVSQRLRNTGLVPSSSESRGPRRLLDPEGEGTTTIISTTKNRSPNNAASRPRRP